VNDQRRLRQFVVLCKYKNHNNLTVVSILRVVLGEWFKVKNVPCVPSPMEPALVSNGTGKRGVDPKDRIEHLSDGRGTKKLGGSRTEDRMKTKDNGRKWMWWFLGVLVALQLYFVRELLAVFALFTVGFAAIAFVVISLYMLQKSWEVAVGRVADSNHPVVNLARRGVSSVEDMVRRPLRRPGSAAPRTV
jgi:hypothetical protein